MGKDDHDSEVAEMLSESGYSEKAIHYFQSKENIGTLEEPDQVTSLTGPCGDTMKISLNVKGNRIDDARIQVLGCPGAVASGCALINLIKGKSLREAGHIDLDALYREVEKLPDQKIHCARLAVNTLKRALEEYEGKRAKK